MAPKTLTGGPAAQGSCPISSIAELDPARRPAGPRAGVRAKTSSTIACVVDLSPATVHRLRQHRVVWGESKLRAAPAYDAEGLDLVFSDPLGRPIHQTNLRTAWLRIIKKAELPGLRFHDVRYQHASLLLKQGTPMKVVQERLGHANLATTADLYSHVAPTMQTEAVSKLDALLANS